MRPTLLCTALVCATACGLPDRATSGPATRTIVHLQSDGAFTVTNEAGDRSGNGGEESAALTVDNGCTAASLRLWDQLHFTGDELCFFGDGTAQLASFPRPNGTWTDAVWGMQVGLNPVFLNGAFEPPNDPYSWFYPAGFVDDIGSDLPRQMQGITLTTGPDYKSVCPANATCGTASGSDGHIVFCGIGGCANGAPCISNQCCVANNDVCGSRVCGSFFNNCGQIVDCGLFNGNCPTPDQTCTSAGQCCKSRISACGDWTCDTVSDGCGHTISCGACPDPNFCDGNHHCQNGVRCRRHCKKPLVLDPDSCSCVDPLNG
jgi:hypothetical protein